MNSESETNTGPVSEILRQISDQSEYYGHGIIKLVLIKKNNEYHVKSGVISLLQKNEKIIEEMRDYGDIIFKTELFNLDQLRRVLKELEEKQSISLINGSSLDAKGQFGQYYYFPSHKLYGYLYSTWPRGYVEYRLDPPQLPITNEPLAKLGHPLYPDGTKAVADFLELRTINPFSSIIIQIPDYRVRIENLIISEKSVKLKIDSRLENKNLIAKFYADDEGQSNISSERYNSMHSPNLPFKENEVKFSFDKEFTNVLGLVMERNTEHIFDYLGYSFRWGPDEGVTIEYQELEIREIIRRGENLQVELKQNLDNPERVLKTVVAFANTRGGRIFIGVSDETRIIGFDHDKHDQIANLIAGNLSPLPDFKISNLFVNDIPITIIEVPVGDNKPYSHRELGVFVRSGSSNRPATRTDTDRIYQEKKRFQFE